MIRIESLFSSYSGSTSITHLVGLDVMQYNYLVIILLRMFSNAIWLFATAS